jgi:hypothetical protein
LLNYLGITQTFNPLAFKQFANQTFNQPVAEQLGITQTFNPLAFKQFVNQTFDSPVAKQFRDHSTIKCHLFRRRCEPWRLLPEAALPQQQPGAAAHPDVATCP